MKARGKVKQSDTITIAVTSDLKRELQQIAAYRKVSTSRLARVVLEDFLKAYKMRKEVFRVVPPTSLEGREPKEEG